MSPTETSNSTEASPGCWAALCFSIVTGFFCGPSVLAGAAAGGQPAEGLAYLGALGFGWGAGFVGAFVWYIAVRDSFAKFAGILVGVPVAMFVLMAVITDREVQERRAKAEIAKTEFIERCEAQTQRLKSDPEIALSEEWHREVHGDPRWVVLRENLVGGDIRFSSDQLRRMAGTDREISIAILGSPSADAEYLRGRIEDVITSAESRRFEFLEAIVANRNTPEDVLEQALRWSETQVNDPTARDIGAKARRRLSGAGGK